MRLTLTLLTLAFAVVLVSCGQTSNVEPEAQPRPVEAPTTTTVVSGHPVDDGVITDAEAQRLCTQEYDTVVAPFVVPVPDRTTYVDGCVVDLLDLAGG